MAQSFRLDRLNLIYIQIQFGRLRWDVFGDLFEFCAGAADDCSSAAALGRAVVLSKTAHIIQLRTAEVKRWDVLQGNVLDPSRTSAPGCSGAQLLFLLTQPVTKPGHVAVAVKRIAQNVPCVIG